MSKHVPFAKQQVGNFYAVGRYGSRKALLLEVRVGRVVGRSYLGNHTEPTGARVQIEGEGCERVIRMLDILAPWDEYQAAEAEAKRLRDESNTAWADGCASVEALVKALNELGVNVELGHKTNKLTLSSQECREILAVLKDRRIFSTEEIESALGGVTP